MEIPIRRFGAFPTWMNGVDGWNRSSRGGSEGAHHPPDSSGRTSRRTPPLWQQQSDFDHDLVRVPHISIY
jgi:hypothetical protein